MTTLELSVHELEILDYRSIIKHLSKTGDMSLINDIKYFYQKYKRTTNAVLNAILIHSMKLQQGHVPNLSYLDKAYKTWVKDYHINTAVKAVKQLYYELNKEAIKKKAHPDWVDDYWDGLNQMEN